MSILTVANLSKSFGGVRALSNVSFSLAAGELLAMIGPNGAGKTTCFNLINGQLRPDAGEVFLDERKIHGLAPRELWRFGVGRSFQIAAAFGSMSVQENVQVALLSYEKKLFEFQGKTGSFKVKEAENLLSRVGMLDQAQRPCGALAYGDLKRVELALALAGRPRLLLMDEPTSGMAAAERNDLMKLTAALARDSGIAVLFTEHDMDVVFAYASRIIVLAEGELIAQGSPAEVRANERVRRAYLGDEFVNA